MNETKDKKKVFKFSVNSNSYYNVLAYDEDKALILLLKSLLDNDDTELYNGGELEIDLEESEVEIPTEENPVVYLDE